jgi:hypothetical protein
VKQFFVYFVAKDPGQYQVGNLTDKMAAVTRRENAKHDFRDHLRLPRPARVGAVQAPGASVPDTWNIQREGEDGASVEFLNSAYAECMKASRFGLNLRTVMRPYASCADRGECRWRPVHPDRFRCLEELRG